MFDPPIRFTRFGPDSEVPRQTRLSQLEFMLDMVRPRRIPLTRAQYAKLDETRRAESVAALGGWSAAALPAYGAWLAPETAQEFGAVVLDVIDFTPARQISHVADAMRLHRIRGVVHSLPDDLGPGNMARRYRIIVCVSRPLKGSEYAAVRLAIAAQLGLAAFVVRAPDERLSVPAVLQDAQFYGYTLADIRTRPFNVESALGLAQPQPSSVSARVDNATDVPATAQTVEGASEDGSPRMNKVRRMA